MHMPGYNNTIRSAAYDASAPGKSDRLPSAWHVGQD